MARTILDIAIEAAERDATAPAPTALFGVNNRISRILRTAVKDTIREYLTSARWQGLSEFHSTWVFALRAGRFAYELPPDFLRTIPGTEQRDGWPLGVIGPATPQAWAAWVFGGQASATPMGWRIRNNLLFIDPTPTAAELVTVEYISRYPVVSPIQAGDYNLNVSPPQTYAPVVSRDGWLDLQPAGTSVLNMGTGGTWDAGDGWDVATWPKEPEEILKRINPQSGVAPLPEVRRAEFTADTDKPAFDDDFPLSLGMTFRLRRALGLPYAEHAAEYENELQMKGATDAGGPRDIHFGYNDGADVDVLPLGSGRWMVG